MKPPVVIFAVLLFFSAPLICLADWQLVGSDEFSLPDGSSPDSSKWGYNTGGGGYGNNELESYTSRTNNARIVGGNLIIEADKETYTGADNIKRNYTSARMLTQNKWSWTYGRFEARIKIPRGQGIWPAFWMLGNNIGSGVAWPTCGEIDIMENIGKTSEQGIEHATLHGPQNGGDYNGGAGITRSTTLPGGAVLGDDFHIYAAEWTTNQIKFFLDTNLFATITPANVPSGGTWVFTAPEFIILNVAVGGNWPGAPDGTTVFPQQMLVDYVHVYSYVTGPTNPPSPFPVAIQCGGQVSWPTTNGTTWTLQAAPAGGGWANLLGPAAGDGTTHTNFDPLWPAQDSQYQVLQTTVGMGNIVPNSGFETGTNAVAAGWTVAGSQSPTRVSTAAHSGSYAMQLQVTNTAATPNTSEIDENIGTAGGAPVVGGQTYTFSMWAKQVSSGVSYVQYYGITWLNSVGGTAGSVGPSAFTAGSGAWSQFTVSNLVAPASAVNAALKIYVNTGAVLNGYGGVLVDDVALSYATGNTTNVLAASVAPAIQLGWPTTSVNLYDVQWSGDLSVSNWVNLVSSMVGNGSTNTATDLMGTNQSRYYRIVQH